mmetsp:Transcript_99573/g.249644  ORF Transcript_99573/g.249644 Transcript_99573/m.249644 type:complete len:261 (+) Transcript_99573:726-1508(+)
MIAWYGANEAKAMRASSSSLVRGADHSALTGHFRLRDSMAPIWRRRCRGMAEVGRGDLAERTAGKDGVSAVGWALASKSTLKQQRGIPKSIAAHAAEARKPRAQSSPSDRPAMFRCRSTAHLGRAPRLALSWRAPPLCCAAQAAWQNRASSPSWQGARWPCGENFPCRGRAAPSRTQTRERSAANGPSSRRSKHTGSSSPFWRLAPRTSQTRADHSSGASSPSRRATGCIAASTPTPARASQGGCSGATKRRWGLARSSG